jgi:8-oxo-dGTP pyrophosphatase MutT (NUDIX family)
VVVGLPGRAGKAGDAGSSALGSGDPEEDIVVVQPFDEALRERLRADLSSFDRREVAPAEGVRHAAVAIVLVGDADGRTCTILTRRASRLRAHGGQWSLPGGRVDPGEDPESAARRELHEELDATVGECLGLLDDYPTRSGYRITPVVLWGGAELALRPNPDEVASAHLVPFEGIGAPRFLSIPESDRPVIQLPLLGTLLHAPTAAVLHQAVELARHGRTTRVDHLEQPVFAWR